MNWIQIIIAVGLMLGIGAILGILLALADAKLAVKVDERVEAVNGMLPGVNCGACGYPGCLGLAEALVSGEVGKVSTCRVSKPDARVKIKEYMDTTPGPDGQITQVEI